MYVEHNNVKLAIIVKIVYIVCYTILILYVCFIILGNFYLYLQRDMFDWILTSVSYIKFSYDISTETITLKLVTSDTSLSITVTNLTILSSLLNTYYHYTQSYIYSGIVVAVATLLILIIQGCVIYHEVRRLSLISVC